MLTKDYKIEKAYFTKRAENKQGEIALSQFSIFLKKQDIQKLFHIPGSTLNVYICRHKEIVERRVTSGKKEILIDLFKVLPYLLKSKIKIEKKL